MLSWRIPVDYPGVTSRKLISCRAIVALPKDHRLAAQDRISVKDLERESLIGLGTDAMIQTRISRLFERQGGAPPLAINTSSLLAVRNFVASGFGCGIVDPLTASAVRDPWIEFHPLEPALQLEYGVLWNKGQPLSGLLSQVCTELAIVAG